MAEKRVKVGLKFDYVPAVKSGRGWLALEKGKFGKVRFESRSQKLELWIKEGEKWRRELYPVEEYARANAAARAANAQGKAAGTSFGALRPAEIEALKIWRGYEFDEMEAGRTPRPLPEIMRELVEREAHKDETPPFREVVFKFIEAKDAAGGISLLYRNRLRRRLETLSKHFRGKRIGEITESEMQAAILKRARSRDGAPPAPKTQKHWIETAKEVFKWFYERENATRRPAEKLNNPLALAAAPKVSAAAESPEILTIADARAILAEIYENEIDALPAVAVQMFCGVRNAEALRLRWKDFRGGEIHLSRAITKTKQARAVPVPANLRAWIDAYAAKRGRAPAPQDLIFPFNETPAEKLAALSPAARAERESVDFHSRGLHFAEIMRRAVARAGTRKPRNAFRHTAATALSVLYGHSRAADYCGHSLQIQGANYRGLMTETEAKDYFGIVPPAGDGKAIAFSRERAGTPADAADGTQAAAL